jgi:hypothetical protein
MSDPVTGDVFKPGDVCNRSGVYRVLHDPNHADEHEVARNSHCAIAAVIMFDSSWNMVQFTSTHKTISRVRIVQPRPHCGTRDRGRRVSTIRRSLAARCRTPASLAVSTRRTKSWG